MPVPLVFASAITSSSGMESYGVTTRATPSSTARRCASVRLPTTTMSFSPIVLPIVSAVDRHRPEAAVEAAGRRHDHPAARAPPTISSTDAGRSAKLEGSPDSLM